MRIRDILGEAKQSVMFHGTSSALLRSIMVNGIQPNPKERTWQDDPQASDNRPSRESLEGSYWTSNFLTAMAAAWNTAKKFGGDRLLVCALIQEQAAFADEDSLNSKIANAYGQTMGEVVPGVVPDAVAIHLSAMMYKPELSKTVPQRFAEHMHTELQGNPKMPVDYATMGRILHDFMMRKLAHIKQTDPYNWNWPFRDMEPPAVPSISEAEQAYHRDLDWLTRRYRSTASSDVETFNHTLRLTLPVGFRGANRIICILAEIIDQNTRDRQVRLFYGQPPPYLIQQWEKSFGPWPGAVTETKKLPGPQVIGSGKNFRQQSGTNPSPPQPGNLVGSGEPLKVKPGFVG